MTPRLPLTCRLLLVLFAVGPAAAVGAGDVEARVEALFAPWDSTRSPGCAVGVVREGKLVLARGYGMADLEHGVPITPGTRFDVASVGKQFTAYAIARLVHEGKLSLDDDYRTHLPEMPDFGPTITVGHLVHHTSGIRDYFALLALTGVRPGDDSIMQEDVLRVLRNQRELNFEPGSEYLYSNSGYVLLATIVERVSGKSFHDWMTEHLFAPLGMTATETGDDYARIVPDRAEPYAPARNGDYRRAATNYEVFGPGLTYASVEDMARWIAHLGHPTEDDAAVIERMFECVPLNQGQANGYAFGLNIGTHRGHRVADHSGSWSGYRTFLAWFPDQDLGVIVLSNLTAFDAVGMGRQLADLYLPEPEPEAEADRAGEETPGPAQGVGAALRTARRAVEEATDEPRNLEEFAGNYVSPELKTIYSVSVQDGRLTASHPRHGEIRLRPDRAPDRFAFQTRGLGGQVAFERDDEGRMKALKITNDRTRNVRFERID